MSDFKTHSAENDAIEEVAYGWVQREAAGFSAQDRKAFAVWLSSDARHEAAYAEYKAAWERMTPLADAVVAVHPIPHPGVLDRSPMGQGDFKNTHAPARPSLLRRFAPALAAAAVLALGVTAWIARSPAPPREALTLPAPIQERTLPDGSKVELNRGAQIDVAFTPTERLIHLTKGEANFTVAKNPLRPFVVAAGGVRVRAVGTVFNVRYAATAVDVIVTEGKVRVDPPPAAATSSALASFVEAGQQTSVPLLAGTLPTATTLTASDLDRALLWQPRLLDFDDTPVTEIAAEFNRRNPVHLVVASPILGARRLTASLRSDNVEGFVRLLESQFGVRAERVGDGEISLSQK